MDKLVLRRKGDPLRLLLLWLSAAASNGFGQKVVLSPPSFDTPVVHRDRSVSFRLAAPRARSVALHGEWMPEGTSESMHRQNDGTWTLRTRPLEPDLYLYAFEVDGLRVADPANRVVKNGYPGVSSLLEVPGADFLSTGAVEHGTIHIHHYHSAATNSLRRMHVYTPSGYDRASGQNYPVLFLLHGSWDNDAAWMEVGRAGVIMDNLLARKRVEPMLLVSLDGHPFPSFDVSTRPRNLDLLRRDLLEEVLPFVERRYRVTPNRSRRALAGLSMGGTQALHLGLTTGQFGSVAAFSGPADVPHGSSFEAMLRATASQERPEFLWIACGRNDPYLREAEAAHTILSSYGVAHVWRETAGGHTWMVWRRHFVDFATALFRSKTEEKQ